MLSPLDRSNAYACFTILCNAGQQRSLCNILYRVAQTCLPAHRGWSFTLQDIVCDKATFVEQHDQGILLSAGCQSSTCTALTAAGNIYSIQNTGRACTASADCALCTKRKSYPQFLPKFKKWCGCQSTKLEISCNVLGDTVDLSIALVPRFLHLEAEGRRQRQYVEQRQNVATEEAPRTMRSIRQRTESELHNNTQGNIATALHTDIPYCH
jgi:hypothetical protein